MKRLECVMIDNSENPMPGDLDPIERLMLEVGGARQAGVFRRTSVDPSVLRASPISDAALGSARPNWFHRHRHAWVGLPVAACLAVIAFLGVVHHGEPGSDFAAVSAPESGSPLGTHAVAFGPAEMLKSCLTGPGQGPVPPECASADVDGDGDVDLRDFGELQVSRQIGP
jgi:hypothetical protein